MNTTQLPHEWSKDAFINKAQRYADLMMEQDRMSWQFGLWSAIVLELLIRATISNVSPVLNADIKKWENIYFALGHNPNTSKFTPKSASVSDLSDRILQIFPNYTKEMHNFAITHFNRRNSELHSGSLPFDELDGTSTWLPVFYSICEVLLNTMNESLEFLFKNDEATNAKIMIKSLKDETSSSIKDLIKEYEKKWNQKTPEEKEISTIQANTHASRHFGHRVQCPSCKNKALLQGTAIGEPKKQYDDNEIVERQTMMPSSFECFACGLKISGYSKLQACNLGGTYTSTSHYEPAEYFDLQPEREWYGMEDDNNEP